MISNFKNFISEFLNRDGFHILYATILARILSFFASWIALQLIPNFELGLVIYAINIISLIIPLSGLGASQGLLRYGALLSTREEKNKLFVYVLKKGSVLSIFLIIITILLSGFLTGKLIDSKPYLIAASITIFTLFLLDSLKTQFRVLHQNKLFASTEILYNILLVMMVFFGSYFFKESGYIAALIIAPLLTFLIFLPKIKFNLKISNPLINPKLAFWKYSFYTGLSNVATQLLIVLDIILIGTIIKNPEMVTIYKYLSLIPFSLLFLPRVILTTDFVTLTENFSERIYINRYIKNYIFIFLVISFFILIISIILNKQILLIFGEEFVQYNTTFLVLIFGVTGILILRGLFGNLLSAMGKASVNYWISIIAIIVNLISNYILIPKYGILGAAITSTIIMWLTSILSVVFFYYFQKKI
ncbi:MAG: polysaccharide biosynthesis C-terminal domain-containing protein [Bacteroidota bacterium]